MEIRRTDNTVFKANVFDHCSRAKSSEEALNLALKRRFIRKKMIVGELTDNVKLVEFGYLVLDRTTLAAKLLGRLVGIKSFIECSSPLKGLAREHYQAALNDIARDASTKKI